MGATPGAALSLPASTLTRMKSLPFTSPRRLRTWLGTLLAVAWLAAGCDNSGGVGDGNYDDSIWPGGGTGASTGGKSNSSHGGMSSANGGAGGHGFMFGGRGGMLNAPGGGGPSGGVSGSVGASGSGTGGSAGSVGTGGSSTGTGGSGTGTGGKGGSSAGGSGPTGGTGPLTCGNGKVDSGETCDDGPLPGSSSAGTGGTGGSGTGGGGTGGGGTGSGEEGGGTGPVVATFGQKCSNTCYKVGTQECLDCEFGTDCYESVNNCLGPENMPFTTGEQSACFAVMRCIQNSNCLDGAGTLGKCYCGTLSTTACGSAPFAGAGSPDGACVNEIKAGAPTLTSNSAILASLGNGKDFPSSAATQRLSCQKKANEGACVDKCGFTSGGPAFP